MKMAVNVVLAIAAISFVLSVISRLTMKVIPIAPGGIEAEAFLAFTNTCLLISITLILLQKK